MDRAQKRILTQGEKTSKPARRIDATEPQIDAALIQRAIEVPRTLTAESAAMLQHTHGNRFVGNLVRGKGSGLTVQAKLTITEAGDHLEQEADRVAETAVSRMALQRQPIEEEEELIQASREGHDLQRQDDLDDEELMMARDNQLVQRQAEEEEELMMARDDLAVQRQDIDDEDDELMMARDSDPLGNTTVTPEIESQISSSRGGGQAIPNSIRTAMEDSIGADFSGVRVHTNSQADTLSRSLQAKAFTTGSDIFFKQGQYNPASSDGQKLLAHELTHTIQQGAAPSRKR